MTTYPINQKIDLVRDSLSELGMSAQHNFTESEIYLGKAHSFVVLSFGNRTINKPDTCPITDPIFREAELKLGELCDIRQNAGEFPCVAISLEDVCRYEPDCKMQTSHPDMERFSFFVMITSFDKVIPEFDGMCIDLFA